MFNFKLEFVLFCCSGMRIKDKTMQARPDSSGIAAFALAKFYNFSKVVKIVRSSNKNG